MTAGLEHFFLNQYSTVEQLVHLRGEPRLLHTSSPLLSPTEDTELCWRPVFRARGCTSDSTYVLRGTRRARAQSKRGSHPAPLCVPMLRRGGRAKVRLQREAGEPGGGNRELGPAGQAPGLANALPCFLLILWPCGAAAVLGSMKFRVRQCRKTEYRI